MSWREFQLRSYGFKRAEKNDLHKVREIAWNALVGSHQNPKTLPKSKEKFMPLNEKVEVKRSSRKVENFLVAYKQYLNERRS